MDESQLAQYNAMFNSLSQATTPTASATTTPNAVNTMQNYFNTAQYQNQFGANDNQADPYQRFLNDPGMSQMINQSIQPILNQSVSKGLGQSSQVAQLLQNNQNNYYQNWLSGQQNLFSNYQGQLAQMAGQGAQYTGATQANANDANLAGLLGGYNMSTGSSLSNANLQTGSNISSLLANLGSALASMQLNTGAAQANNLFAGYGLGTQMDSNAAASSANQSSNSNNLQSFSSGTGGSI